MFKIVGTVCNLAFLVWVLAGQPAHASLTTKSLTTSGFVGNGAGNSGWGAGVSPCTIDSVEMAPVAR